MSERGFQANATTGLSVTDTTGNVALAAAASVVLVQNMGAKVCYIKLGASGVTATTSDFPLGPGAAIPMDQGTFTYIAAICASTESTTLKMTSGGGLAFMALSAQVALSGVTVTADAEGTATAAAPSYSEGTSNNISMNLAGALRVIYGTLGQAVMAASVPVTLASNQSALAVTLTSTTITGTVAVTQSGTWNVATVTTVTAVTDITNAVKTRPAANTTGTQSNVASSASDVTILASNASRLGATIYNDSTQILYLLLSNATSSTTVYTVQMATLTYYEVPFGYSGTIKGIWASANGSARVTEITA